MWNSPRKETFLPARGHAIVTITVLDENGFTHLYTPMELRLDILAQVIPQLSASADDQARSASAATRTGRKNR